MKFGVNTFPRDLMTTREAYIDVSRTAEALGYEFLSISDHVIIPGTNDSDYPYSKDAKWKGGGSGFCFEMLTAMSFVVGCTERIKVLSSIMVVPHRPAVLTAKMLSSMDVLSKGRVLLGVGTGWLKEEFDALATPPFEHRGQVTDEFIEAMKELWSRDQPTYDGTYVKFSEIAFLPKPYRQSHIPIWVGGESNLALRRTVRHGDVWFPGNNNPRWRLDTPERLRDRIATLHDFAETEGRDPASIGLGYVWFYPVTFSATPGVDSARRMLSGSADEMAADISALQDLGVTHLSVGFSMTSVTEMTDMMQRFAEEVMAHVV